MQGKNLTNTLCSDNIDIVKCYFFSLIQLNLNKMRKKTLID